MTEKNESVNSQTDNEEQVNSYNEEEHEDKITEDQESQEQSSEDLNESSDELNDDQEHENDEPSKDIDPKDEEIQKLKDEVKENEDKYLRLYAEFENYKRRLQKENQTMKKYQSQSVLTDILPTIDNIERALQIEGEDEQFKSLQKGVKMVHESLLKALEDNGLEVIKTEGENFDPNYHQAVMQDDNPEFEANQITQELQTGYKLKDRVLRPSMVKVNQ
ncbi:nucleotide exchange factor GrpE [Staphylococcus sp. SQ8-PEA]|uniref:Protein GrpE n=1 Tax=Staphylococcus marylandisciuri TaxID=2981529 RepID=A0ABT2QQY8_9STAP|nr:nucleotide exchange factor GrpE [Staphylococcus marylandisciuri]MCU5746399.1 nucleotide exchange factor GrpE [Staphylococcus marylandisciuri]